MSDFIIKPEDNYNKKLIKNVHPVGWENPEPKNMYNLVVIGAGASGLVSSIITSALGGSVALIEKNLLGGDCLNYGCVPSKSLIRSARVAYEIKNAGNFGLTGGQVSSDDFSNVMERLRNNRACISENDSAERYSKLGVDVYLGEASFLGNRAISVGSKILRFKKAVIASGARAAIPEIDGLESVKYYTNETIFELTELPEKLVVIGGGPIGCELAQAFSRLGTDVSIIQKGRLLPREDSEAVDIIQKSFLTEGIKLYLNSKIMQVEKQDGRKILFIKHGGQEIKIATDTILIGVGRKHNVEKLNLENAGVEYDIKKGVLVNDFLQTSNKRIYAAGDCCMKWKFTHAADSAAQIVIQNALFKGKKKLSDLVMPWTTFTDPEVAHVGMYEHDATNMGLDYECYKVDLASVDRAILDGEETGFVKVMVKKGSDKILGATIVASHAGEMISEITTCITCGVGLKKLSGVIHPYPTQAEGIKRVAGEFNKSRLTPFVKTLLAWWLRIQR